MQLLDLPLDHPLAKYLQKSLRRLKGQRHKPRTKARRNDQCTIYLKFFQKSLSEIRQFISTGNAFPLRDQPFLHRFLN